MFKKICFMVCAISMFCSAESFAVKEDAEKRSLSRTHAKHMRNKHAAEKRAKKAVARATSKRRLKNTHVAEKRAKKVVARAISKRRVENIHAAEKRAAKHAATSKKRTEKSLRKQAHKAIKAHQKQVKKPANNRDTSFGNIPDNTNGQVISNGGNDFFFEDFPKNSASSKTSFTGRTNLKNTRKDSLNVSGPFEFDNIEVKNDTHISGFTSRSRNGKFNNLKVSGSFEATDVTCKNFNVSGAAVVDNLEVENEASISGAVNASNMRCRTLNVSGAVIAEKLKVAQDASISGRLGAAQSHFQNLKVASDTIVLKDTQVDGNITVRNIHGWPNKQQVLRLEGNTRIKGTITFESGKGLIEKTPAVMLSVGSVRGARMTSLSNR